MENPIGVEFASRIVLSMKAVGHDSGSTNRNIVRQHGIKRPHPAGRRPIPVRTKTCRLPARMNTGVCPACADDRYPVLTDLVDGSLDSVLDRGVIGLALPTGITGSIVFYD